MILLGLTSANFLSYKGFGGSKKQYGIFGELKKFINYINAEKGLKWPSLSTIKHESVNFGFVKAFKIYKYKKTII